MVRAAENPITKRSIVINIAQFFEKSIPKLASFLESILKLLTLWIKARSQLQLNPFLLFEASKDLVGGSSLPFIFLKPFHAKLVILSLIALLQ